MMRRKRREIHTNHERWLVSYADFITLLFAFFVVLYASAQVDQRKIGKLAVAIQVAFQELGVFPDSNIGVRNTQPAALEAFQVIEKMKKETPNEMYSSSSPETPDSDQDVLTLESELTQALASEIATHAVALHREAAGLIISLREFGFFDSGSATLKPGALPALDRIASILALRSCRLRIEGHTDNVPIHTTSMVSNWELSTARATELVRLLIVRYGISPERLSAAGYAQYHPISSNDTSQGRAQNRRVDIVVLGDHAVQIRVPSKPPAGLQ